MALVPPSAEALLDFQKRLRELASALRDKGIPVADDAPLVDFIRAVRSADGVPEVIEICKEQMLWEWKNKTLPAMRFSTTYTVRPSARYLFFNNIFLEKIPSMQGLELLLSTEGMFQGCSSLREVTLPAMPAVTTAASMFQGCSSLREVTLPAMPAVEDIQRLAQECKSLVTLTIGEVPNATNSYCMCYNGNKSLRKVSITTSNKLGNAAYTFSGCYALEVVEGIFDITGATNIVGCFDDCSALKEVRIRGLHDNIGLIACKVISKESLRYLIDNALPVTGKTITLSSSLSTRSELKETLEYVGAKAVDKGFSVVYR